MGVNMLIFFHFNGGYMNLDIDYEVNTKSLQAEEAQKLEAQVEQSGIWALKQTDIQKSPDYGPVDIFHYNLKIVSEDKRTQLDFNDITIPNSLQSLISLLRDLALQSREGN